MVVLAVFEMAVAPSPTGAGVLDPASGVRGLKYVAKRGKCPHPLRRIANG